MALAAVYTTAFSQILPLVHHFTQNIMYGKSPVAKTLGIHPKLISLIRINSLEYRMHKLFINILKELDQEWPV